MDAGPLMELDGEEFVRASYLRILGRQPDVSGLRHNAEELRLRNLTKPELLMALAESPEGRRLGVRVVGLAALPLERPLEILPDEPADRFVRALGRYYNGREPADDSLARWVELIESGSLTREEAAGLFAASAKAHRRSLSPAEALDELEALTETVAEVRRELDAHQRALEAFPSRRK